jgi:hypothetical protein
MKLYLIGIFFFILGGCNMSVVENVVQGRKGFDAKFSFALSYSDLRWEVFQTPEPSVVPGPTSSVTLIAEFSPEKNKKFDRFYSIQAPEVTVEYSPIAEDNQLIALPSNIDRSWLSGNVKKVMAEVLNGNQRLKCKKVDLRTLPSESLIPAALCRIDDADVLIANISENI